jgi:hypothetical protein
VQREDEAAVCVDGERANSAEVPFPACVSSFVSAKRAVIWPVARAMPGSAPSILRSARMVRPASTLFE